MGEVSHADQSQTTHPTKGIPQATFHALPQTPQHAKNPVVRTLIPSHQPGIHARGADPTKTGMPHTLYAGCWMQDAAGLTGTDSSFGDQRLGTRY